MNDPNLSPPPALGDGFIALDGRTGFPTYVDMDWRLDQKQQNGGHDEQGRPQLHSSSAFSPPDSIRQLGQVRSGSTTASHHPQQADVPDFLISPISDPLLDVSHYDLIAHMDSQGQQEAANYNLDIFGELRQESVVSAALGSHGDSLRATQTGLVTAATEGPHKPLPFLLVEERKVSSATLTLDQNIHDSICQDLGERLRVEDASQEIPPATVCQVFLSSYVDFFQCNLPVIHLPSLCLRTTPSPLVLAMCSIGALYRLDRKRARRLHNVARRALQQVGATQTPPRTTITE